MDKREFLIGSLLATQSAAAANARPKRRQDAKSAPAAKSPREKRMNLLFITADDLDWHMIGFMGSPSGLTPNLDKLATRSNRFVNSHTVAAICQPSREAMMSGLVPPRSGGMGFIPIDGTLPTLTSILKKHGYFTAGIHKLQHMQPPTAFPWDFISGGTNGDLTTWDNRDPIKIAVHVREAIAQAASKGKPFYVNANITDPHRPFYGSPEADKQDHHQEGPYKIPHEFGPGEVIIPPHLEDLPDIRKELAQYYCSIFRMDMAIGNILTTLEESGNAENTCIVFSSDHGMPFPFSKSSCYDSGTRTPAVIYCPGLQDPKEYDFLCSNIDLMPTVLDLLEIEENLDIDGRSWMPLMKGAAKSVRSHTFSYIDAEYMGELRPTRSVFDGRYLLIFSAWSNGELKMEDIDAFSGLTYRAMVQAAPGNPEIARRVKQCTYGFPLALYDVKADPGQRNNLLDHPDQRARISLMKALLLDQLRKTGDPQAENFERHLRGERTEIPQDPQRWRHYNWIAG